MKESIEKRFTKNTAVYQNAETAVKENRVSTSANLKRQQINNRYEYLMEKKAMESSKRIGLFK